VCLDDELADVHGPVTSCDVGDHHVEPRPVGKGGIHEGAREIQPSSAAAQHPLNEIPELRRLENDVGQEVALALGTEHAPRRVDPDLFDLRVVEERLQWTQPGHSIQDTLLDALRVLDPGEGGRLRSSFIVINNLRDEPRHASTVVLRRIEAPLANQVAHLPFDHR
jgi:hypothetical protein